MKIVFTLLVATLMLFAQGKSKESCYTVQLVSKYDTEENKKTFERKSYPNECKLMHIGSMLTMRCGCYDNKNKALESLKKYKKTVPNAIVRSTYKYRFGDKLVSTKSPKVIVPTPSVLATPVISKTPTKSVVIPAKEIVVVDESSKKDIKEKEKKKHKKGKKKKHKKKKKGKKKHKKGKKKKKHKKKEINKEEIDKTTTQKPIKRKQRFYKYTRYLKSFKSNRGIGKYDYRYSFGGQLSYDFGYLNEAYYEKLDHDFRRLRIYHKGSFFDKDLFYELEYSFIGNRYKDVLIGYKAKTTTYPLKYSMIVGNQKVPFSLESYSSSKYITFMERSLIDLFDEGRKLGIKFTLSSKYENNYFNLFVMPFSNSIDERIENDENQVGIALRGTYAYKFRKNHLISLGTSYIREDINDEDIRFKQGAESEFIREKYVSEKIKNVDLIQKNNIEFLYIYDKYSFMSEYTRVQVDSLVDRYSFHGYYLEGSYFLFGDAKSYKMSSATLAKIKPYGFGALEMAFRYSKLSLIDQGLSGVKPENGGSQIDYTYALNWYITNEFKASLNYIVANPKDTDDYDGLFQIVQARILFAF